MGYKINLRNILYTDILILKHVMMLDTILSSSNTIRFRKQIFLKYNYVVYVVFSYSTFSHVVREMVDYLTLWVCTSMIIYAATWKHCMYIQNCSTTITVAIC